MASGLSDRRISATAQGSIGPAMGKEIRGQLTASGHRFAIVVSRFHEAIAQRLLESAQTALRAHGLEDGALDVFWVPGAFELPTVARRLAAGGAYQAVICLGVILRGETPHFDHLAATVSHVLAGVGAQTGIPVTCGVITAETMAQAEARSEGSALNRGREAALAAIEMANLMREL